MSTVRAWPASYGFALAALVAAAVARWLLDPALGDHVPFLTFYFATIFAAWYGGLGPGLASLPLGIGAGTYLFTAPRHGFPIDSVAQLDIVRYVGVGVVVSVICELLHRTRRRAELREDQLDATLSSIGDAVIATDTAGRITRMNGVAETLTGWPFAAAAGQSLEAIFQIINEESRQPVENPVTRALREGVAVGLANHTVLVARDGSERLIDDSAAPIRNRAGEPQGCVLVFRDVTARRQDERMLSEQFAAAALLSAIVEASDDAIVRKTPDGIIQSWNPSAERLFGYTEREALGRSIMTLVPAERRAEEDDLLRRIRAGMRIENYDTERVRKDGRRVAINLTISPIHDAAGHVIGAAKLARDITARKRDEKLVTDFRRILEMAVADTALPALLATVCDIVEELYPERLCSFLLPDAEGRHTGLAVGPSLGDGYLRQLEGLRIDPPYVGSCGEALDRGTTVVVADVATDERFAPAWRELLLSHGLQACLSAPIFDSRRSVLASLCLYRRTPGDPIPPDDDALQTIAQVVGIAVQRKRQDEQIQRGAELLRLMVERCPFGIFIVDAGFRIAHMNPDSQTGAFRNVRPVIGRPFDDVMRMLWPEPAATGLIDQFRHTLVTGEACHVKDFEHPRLDVDATESYDIEAHRIPLPDGAQGLLCYYYDTSRLRRAERDLLFQFELNRNITANATTAIFMMDEHSRCTFMNPAAERMTGYAFSEVDGGILHDVIHHHFPDGRIYPVADCPIDRALPERFDVIGHEDVFIRKNGEFFPVAVNAKPIRQNGRPLGTVLEVRDVTKEKEATDAMHRLMSELSDADRRKNEFLATLAHELRNPLAPLQNALEVIHLAGDRAATAERLHDMMARQVKSLVRLVDDLMDMSRITRDRITLKKQRVSLAAVVDNAVEQCRPLIAEMGQQLTVRMPAQPVFVDADPTRLAQVFVNLLNNAAKYGNADGHIRLGVEERAGEAVVSIADNGVGIRADQLRSIFGMFTQVDQTLERAQGGLGIGLTLVQRLVDLHGGRVEARSDGAGLGAEFIVHLPLATAAAAAQPEREEEAAAIARVPLRILVVDDNRDGAESLAMLLTMMGHDTHVAFDGVAGIEAAERYRPDVVLLDIGLPKLNGYEACRRLRAQPWGKEIVIVAATGWGQDEDRRLSQEAGFDHHLVKPVDPEDLLRLLPASKSAPA